MDRREDLLQKLHEQTRCHSCFRRHYIIICCCERQQSYPQEDYEQDECSFATQTHGSGSNAHQATWSWCQYANVTASTAFIVVVQLDLGRIKHGEQILVIG